MSGPARTRVPADPAGPADPARGPGAPPAPAHAGFDPFASSLDIGLDTAVSPRSLAIGGAAVAAALLLLLVRSRRRRSR